MQQDEATCADTRHSRISKFYKQTQGEFWELKPHKRRSSKPKNKKTPRHATPWNQLTPRQKRLRRVSLGILRTARKSDKSLTRIVREYNEISSDRSISTRTVIANTGAFSKRNGRWVAKKHDHIPRMMEIGEKGKAASIEVSSIEEASKIGRYYRAVREYTVDRNPDALRKFEGIAVRDSDGNDHFFETDLEKVEDIDERARANDFPVVYTGD